MVGAGAKRVAAVGVLGAAADDSDPEGGREPLGPLEVGPLWAAPSAADGSGPAAGREAAVGVLGPDVGAGRFARLAGVTDGTCAACAGAGGCVG